MVSISWRLGGWAGRWWWVALVPGRPATFAYSRARACCACSRCRTVGLYFLYLSSLSNVLSFGRLLNMTELLWFRLLNPTVVVSYCQGRPRLVLVNRLEGLNLPRNSATINWPARHDLVVDWAVKLHHKQTNIYLKGDIVLIFWKRYNPQRTNLTSRACILEAH